MKQEKLYKVSFLGTELPYSMEVLAKNSTEAIRKVYKSLHPSARRLATNFKAQLIKLKGGK